jgi:hypothetical protein
MASFHYRIKSGKKGHAARHGAYITRQGCFRQRDDLLWSGFGNLPDWAGRDPMRLFAASDKYERANGSTYREHEVALPNELTLGQLRVLVDRLVRELAGGKPYLYAVHRPASALQGEMNTHLHLMVVDRVSDGIVRSPEQTFSRYNAKHPEQGGCKKDSGGRTPLQVRHDMTRVREKIAATENAVLKEYGHAARVSSKNLREQGINRTAERHLGPARVNRMSQQERQAFASNRAAPSSFGGSASPALLPADCAQPVD